MVKHLRVHGVAIFKLACWAPMPRQAFLFAQLRKIPAGSSWIGICGRFHPNADVQVELFFFDFRFHPLARLATAVFRSSIWASLGSKFGGAHWII